MQQQKTLNRTTVLAVILLGVMTVFLMRLFWLQIIKHDEYREIAREAQQRSFVIPAARGEIYMMDDTKAVPVVMNRVAYTVIADPELIKEAERQKIVDALRDVAGGELVGDIEAKLAKKSSRYEVLARSITRTQAESLKAYKFTGMGFQGGSIRSYPEGQLAAQVLGFVNTEGKGQYGIEQQMDDVLRGRDGLLRSVADVQNVPLTLGKDNIRIEPKRGKDIVLTIDRNVQSYAEEALRRGIEKAGATEGSVLVLDPRSGHVLAMANYPAFYPAEYGKVKDASVFVNDITMAPYEPASVVKTFTLAAGIDKGVIHANSTYQNSDCIQVADRSMCNALKGLGGTTTMQSVLNNSLNVGTIAMARKLGSGERIDNAARQVLYGYYYDKFGLGRKTDIEVAEETGYIYPPDTVEGNEVRYSAMTYGQSMNLTMIQVAAGFCSVINGGEYYRPTLVSGDIKDGVMSKSEVKPLRQTVSSQASAEMADMLVQARGSSWMAGGDKPGYNIGGKTGTAETVSASGQYTQDETVATYIGFGGADAPEYVIMVRVAAPGRGLNLEGGIHASPIFTDISNWMIDYKKIAPRS